MLYMPENIWGNSPLSSLMIHRKFNKYNKLNEWETDLLTGRGTHFSQKFNK